MDGGHVIENSLYRNILHYVRFSHKHLTFVAWILGTSTVKASWISAQ